jgi:uncharacterized protein YciI
MRHAKKPHEHCHDASLKARRIQAQIFYAGPANDEIENFSLTGRLVVAQTASAGDGLCT